MRLINTNLLNYFYKNAIKPLKDSLTKKLDASKGANNLLTTEAGFWLDARQGTELKRLIDEQNSNLSDLSGSLADISCKYKDINVTVPENDIVGTATVANVKAILSVSIMYSTNFFNSSAIATINTSNRVTVKRDKQTGAQTFTVRVVYI